MAKPQQDYPATATHGEREDAGDDERRAALEAALAEHGNELDDVLTTAILVAASADDEVVQHITGSAANIIQAADGLSTDGTASLATELGENADDLSDSLETVITLQRQGHLDDLASVATAVSGSLSPEEIQELATLLDEGGGDLVDALDVVLELQRDGDLTALVDTAQALSDLDLDPEAVQGMNALVGALGDAQRTAEPMGILGTISAVRSADTRAGLGYLVTLLRSLGRRVRGRR